MGLSLLWVTPKGSCSLSELECWAEAADHKPDRQSSKEAREEDSLNPRKNTWGQESRQLETSGSSPSGGQGWNLNAGQEATVRTGHGTTHWFQIEKGVRQGCILSPAYLTYMQNTSCEMPGWMKHKAGIKTARRNIKNLNTQMTLWQKVTRN